jgi:hypothetical protein
MSPNNVKLVEGEGLAYDTGLRYDASERDRVAMLRNEGKRGNLYILFDIKFPQNLTKEQKAEVEQLLC